MNKYKKKKTYLEAIGLFMWAGSIVCMFLVAHWVAAVTSLMMSSFIYIFLIHRASDELSKNQVIMRYALAGICLLLSISWLLTHNYNVLIILQMLGCYIGVFEIIMHLVSKKSIWKKGGDFLSRFGFVGWILLLVAVLIPTVILMQVAISPYSLASGMQVNGANVTEAADTETVKLDNGKYMTNDIQYTERYANGFFDIYSASEDFEETKPVFVYIHGGYWTYGDKVNGDPNEEGSGYYEMLYRLVDEGFQVISVNYALSPDYAYPAPIHQMEDLAYFLKEHGAEYGIDAERIVFGGGGSGAQIAAQFVLTQTDEAYANELHIDQVLVNDEIKALYLGTALLDPSQVTDSDVFYVDYFLYHMARAYFAEGSLEKSTRTAQANIITHVTENFPATYITDGNYMTYYRQAQELADKLTELNVENEILNFNQDEYEGEIIMQGYDIISSEFSEMNLEKMADFVSKQVFTE